MRNKHQLKCKDCKNTFTAVRFDALRCTKCLSERRKLWQKSPRGREMRALALRRTRQIVIDAYGGGCQCCGEKNYEFLAIDHVNGGGRKERETLSTYQIVLKVIKNNFPSEYRILCHNCNQAIGWYGNCPHKRTA